MAKYSNNMFNTGLQWTAIAWPLQLAFPLLHHKASNWHGEERMVSPPGPPLRVMGIQGVHSGTSQSSAYKIQTHMIDVNNPNVATIRFQCHSKHKRELHCLPGFFQRWALKHIFYIPLDIGWTSATEWLSYIDRYSWTQVNYIKHSRWISIYCGCIEEIEWEYWRCYSTRSIISWTLAYSRWGRKANNDDAYGMYGHRPRPFWFMFAHLCLLLPVAASSCSCAFVCSAPLCVIALLCLPAGH